MRIEGKHMTEWLQAEVVVLQLLFLRKVEAQKLGYLCRIKAPVDKDLDGQH